MVDIFLGKTPQNIIGKSCSLFWLWKYFMAKGYNTLQKRACIRVCDTTQKNFTDSNFCELERKHRTNHKNTKLLDIPKIATGRMSEDDESGATKILSSDETLLEANEEIKKKLMKKHSPPHSATALPDPPTLIILILLHCWRIYIRASIKSFKKGSAPGHDSLRAQHLQDINHLTLSDTASCWRFEEARRIVKTRLKDRITNIEGITPVREAKISILSNKVWVQHLVTFMTLVYHFALFKNQWLKWSSKFERVIC